MSKKEGMPNRSCKSSVYLPLVLRSSISFPRIGAAQRGPGDLALDFSTKSRP